LINGNCCLFLEVIKSVEAGGIWWSSVDPSIRVSGRLIYGDGRQELALDGALPGVNFEHQVAPITIFGESKGKSITLQRAIISYLQGGITGIHTVKFDVSRVIVGGHFDPDTESIGTARIRITHLDDWVNAQIFDHDLSAGPISIKATIPDPIMVDLVGPDTGQITLNIAASIGSIGPGMRIAQISQGAWIYFKFETNLSLDNFWYRYVDPLVNLMSTCTGVQNFLTEIEIERFTNTRPEMCPVHSDRVHHGEDQERYPYFQMPAPMATFKFEYLPAWISDAQSLGPATTLALDALYGSGFLESRLSEACQAAEGLHRRCFEANRRIPKAVTKQLRRSIMEVVPEEYKDAVLGSLAALGEPTLRTRLEELFVSLDGALTSVVTDHLRWANDAKNARNKQAHLLSDESESNSAEEEDVEPLRRIFLTQAVALVVLTHLMMRCGVTGAELRHNYTNVPSVRTLQAYGGMLGYIQ
jgi:hypothetical protein